MRSDRKNGNRVESPPGTVAASEQSAPSSVDAPPPNLVAFADDRARQFVALLAGVLAEEDPEGVHDLRVWSRRMQQILDVLYFQSFPGKVRKLRRRLRRIRRRVGGWRDCDITLELVREKRRATRSARKRHAWDLVARQLTRRRLEAILRARRWLLRRDVAGVPAALEEAVIGAARTVPEETLRRGIRERIAEAWEAWRAALAEAEAHRHVGAIHALRIAGKRLRYRIELTRLLGEEPPPPTLAWLRRFQDLLGEWHDRQTFYRLTAEVLGRPEVLLGEPEALRVVVADLEIERRRDFSALTQVFALAEMPELRSALDQWMSSTRELQ